MDLQDQLRETILQGNIAEVERLLVQGASVNKFAQNEYPLMTAISNGEIEVALFLLQRSADLSLPPLQVAKEKSFWDINFWLEFTGRIALSMGISAGVSKILRRCVTQSSTVHHLGKILDVWTPLGASVIDFITGLVLPWGDTKGICFRRPATLLGIYSLSCVLQEPARGVMMTMLSWNWRGGVRRVLISIYLDVAIAYYQHLRYPIKELQTPLYPGLEIAESFIGSSFQTEQLAMALLDHGLFPEEYVKEYLRSPYIKPRAIIDFWSTAVSSGFNDVVRRLIVSGFPVDTYITTLFFSGVTSLTIAASHGRLCVVETLLRNGAKVELEPHPDELGLPSFASTPLVGCLSPWNRSDDNDSSVRHQIVKLLIENGADVDILDANGTRPLTVAVERCDIQTVKLLLQHSKNPSLPDTRGRTPAHYTLERDDAVELLELLREGNSDLDMFDKDGYTPLLLAVHGWGMSAAKKLFNLGANPLAQRPEGLTALDIITGQWPRESLLEIGIDMNAHKELACSKVVDKISHDSLEQRQRFLDAQLRLAKRR